MINQEINFNAPQLTSVINNPISEVNIEGRGTGKSYKVGWEMRNCVQYLPRSVCSITGRTYGQVLTRTLPSSLKLLEKLGFVKDKDYKIGGKPPKSWLAPYEHVSKYDNFISFARGTGFLMLSQEREGSSRGPNLDREIADEALTLDKERYDQEVSPANRGNEEFFGKNSDKPVRIHHGFKYVSSMPYSHEQKWLLDYGKYYEDEAGILIFDIWNRIVKLQLQLIEAKLNDDVTLFKEIWNEITRLKRQIAPFVSKDGVLFTLANAFDNLQNLGLSYVIREYKKQSLLTFMIEILNWVIDKVEDCYYSIDPQKHVYYDAEDTDYARGIAEDTNWDPDALEAPDCRHDLDCDPKKPLEIVFDWGSKINLMSVGQERGYNFATKIIEPTDCFINEFFNKPDETSKVMIIDLVDQFCDYYSNHPTKVVSFFRDKYGDHRQPNAANAKSYNAQAIEHLISKGWTVEPKEHRGMEPPQHDKYLLWVNILKGEDSRFPNVAFNGKKCKFTLISMNNTKVIEKNGKFDKDKSSERSKKILPEEATHFGDAADKRIWTKYGHTLHKYSRSFVDARI